jgi:hypothetical protein
VVTPDRITAEFEPAKKSVRWAQEAVGELRETGSAFFQPGVAEIITKFDAQTGEHVKKLHITKRLPESFARKATEALGNSRHAFDQAAFAAWNIVSGPPRDTVYYPWAENPDDLEGRLKRKGFDQRLWDTFKTHEPYGRSDKYTGGDDVIRALATLANRKHTVGLAIYGHIRDIAYPGVIGGFIRIIMPKWDPDKDEAEFLRYSGNPELGSQYHFTFQIVFKEPRFAKPVDAVSALAYFSTKANTVIETLQARCLEITVP